MSKPFDFDIGRLTGEANYSGRPPADFAQTPERGAFFLESFGCQMNDHDSEKVAGAHGVSGGASGRGGAAASASGATHACARARRAQASRRSPPGASQGV